MIHNDLLDNFLDEIIGFATDRSVEVRKFVIGFTEASCIKDSDYFAKLLINLNYFLNDLNANVVKKTIQTGRPSHLTKNNSIYSFLISPIQTSHQTVQTISDLVKQDEGR